MFRAILTLKGNMFLGENIRFNPDTRELSTEYDSVIMERNDFTGEYSGEVLDAKGNWMQVIINGLPSGQMLVEGF